MSRHTVRLQNVVVGHTDLEHVEPELGRARGRFRPGIGYDLVQPVFGLFTRAVPSPGGDVTDRAILERYHRSRDALGLALEDEQGRRIGTSVIHIADYSATRGGGIEIEVLITDRDYWARRRPE